MLPKLRRGQFYICHTLGPSVEQRSLGRPRASHGSSPDSTPVLLTPRHKWRHEKDLSCKVHIR